MTEIGNIVLQALAKRFMALVIVRPRSRCWMWSSDRDLKGYGRFSIENRRIQAHRVSWELHNGQIPSGMSVLHACDVPSCVNPDHLSLGTQKDNVRDMWAKNRHAGQFTPRTHCMRGHEFTKDNTIRRGANRKSCRICRAAWKRAWRLKNKESNLGLRPTV